MESKRAVIIGDVHGCIEELKELLEKVVYNPEKDNIVLVGDLVGKGPHGAEVVRFARLNGFQSVCGNHDYRILKYRKEKLAGLTPTKFKDNTHHVAALALSEEDWKWLEDLPYFIELSDHNVIVVHAGLVPDILLKEQIPQNMMHMRNLTPDNKPLERTNEGNAWASVWKGPKEVVFGHDAVRKLQRHAFATGLDTGCCYGGELTAYILPERTIVSVQAKKEYAPKTLKE